MHGVLTEVGDRDGARALTHPAAAVVVGQQRLECLGVAMQELIETEASAAVGAGRYERAESRTTE